eukprot:scaffold1786_cov181-Skeletonema_marinoi.AAC.7
MLISKHHIANQLNNGGRIYPRNGRNNMQIRTGNRLNNGERIYPRNGRKNMQIRTGNRLNTGGRIYPRKRRKNTQKETSQGQTLDVVGVELPTSVFMHGHVYVGYGRTGDPKGLHIYANQDEFDNIQDHLTPDQTYVNNVVWPELLIH